MTGEQSTSGTDRCPSCGEDSKFYPQGGPGTYFCETCELEFWKEAGDWLCCDADGVPMPVEPTSGQWLGSAEGLRLREPGEDADGPILEIHGDDGMAAVEIADEVFVEKLTEASAEIQMALDENRYVDTDT